MKPLYTSEEFDSAKSRDLLFLECIVCHHPYQRTKNQIQAFIRGNNRRSGVICSRPCFYISMTTKVEISCEHCGKKTHKIPSAIKQTKHNFCSQSCAAKYHNAHKKGGCRVSKLERWLQDELSKLFTDLRIHFNRVDAIKAELDIYVPSLKLAFELNGIFHYEPIFGSDKLATMQTNDQRKMQACLENGIELCILDVSRETYFKPSKAQKYLDIISKLIRSKQMP